ncbi:hypothetical protein A2U01_0116246, partial [Trifolium medium]|nr:hypothetical protein [Trifolium medium]
MLNTQNFVTSAPENRSFIYTFHLVISAVPHAAQHAPVVPRAALHAPAVP